MCEQMIHVVVAVKKICVIRLETAAARVQPETKSGGVAVLFDRPSRKQRSCFRTAASLEEESPPPKSAQSRSSRSQDFPESSL